MRHRHLLTAGQHNVERNEWRGVPNHFEFGRSHDDGQVARLPSGVQTIFRGTFHLRTLRGS